MPQLRRSDRAGFQQNLPDTGQSLRDVRWQPSPKRDCWADEISATVDQISVCSVPRAVRRWQRGELLGRQLLDRFADDLQVEQDGIEHRLVLQHGGQVALACQPADLRGARDGSGKSRYARWPYRSAAAPGAAALWCYYLDTDRWRNLSLAHVLTSRAQDTPPPGLHDNGAAYPAITIAPEDLRPSSSAWPLRRQRASGRFSHPAGALPWPPEEPGPPAQACRAPAPFSRRRGTR